MRIFIRFAGDNDFINTVFGVMEIVRLRIRQENLPGKWCRTCLGPDLGQPLTVPDWMMDKQKLAEFVNQIIYGIYLGFQSDFCRGGGLVDLREYLRIGPEDILFDKEIDLFTNRNHDAAVYDTRLEDLEDYPIYCI